MLCVTTATPPSARDLEIHRLHRVEHLSTRRLAERFQISQTRVRQIVHRAGQWLASMLPAPSDVEREQEQRLAQCLAADQLQSQLEKLQVFWEQTRDPKFLRQQTRVILALARLGVVPGAIDAVAAEAEDTGASVSSGRTGAQTADDSDNLGPVTPEAHSTNTPVRDCSPAASEPREDEARRCRGDSLNDGAAPGSDHAGDLDSANLAALQLIERRLLTLLDNTPPDDRAGRQGLEQTLTNVRRNRAAIEVRVSPTNAGVVVTEFEQQPELGNGQERSSREGHDRAECALENAG